VEDDPDITYEKEGTAAILSFNRPERMNAARIKTHRDLIEALERAEADDTVRAIILTGNGRAFCAGTDIADGFNLPAGGDVATGEGVPPDIGGQTVLRLFKLKKPVIAAVNGAAVGFGASLSIACDIRIASENAKWGFVFTRRGIALESCSSWFLPRIVGISTALDWTLSGRMVSCAEALEARLVKTVTAPKALMDAALGAAEALVSETSPISVAMNRQLMWRMLGAPHPAYAHRLESRALSARFTHPDSKEGVAAFREKRKPEFDKRLDGLEFMQSWWE
jgi:enoyl-CoA hydratase/carnithine racemase